MGVLLGIIVLFFALIVISTLIIGLLLGAMYALSKKGGKHFQDLPYGDFDFNHFQKTPFQELIIKLSGTIAAPLVVLPTLQYATIGPFGLRAHNVILGILLFLLETAAFACGFHFLLKTDRIRTITLTAITAVLYLLIYWLYLYDTLSS